MKRSEIQQSTLAKLHEQEKSHSDSIGSDANDKIKESPTSSTQQGFVFTHQLFKQYQPLNTGLSITIKGPLNKSALKKSLESLTERHEQLRTTFFSTPAGIVAKTAYSYKQPIQTFDLGNLSKTEKTKKIKEIEDSEIQFHFDLTKLPLLRTSLIKVSENEHTLVIVNHHVTGDGTSLFDIYLSDLSILYYAYCNNQNNPLSPIEFSYADFIKSQNEENSGKTLRKRLNFWDEQLKGAPTFFELNTDKQRPAIPTGSGGRIEGKIHADLTDRINELSNSLKINPASVVLAAFYALLYRYSGQEDIVIGLPLANRQAKFTNVFGPLLNTLPLRNKLSENLPFIELVKLTEQASFRTIMRGNLPFETIIANIKHETNSNRSAIHQIVFNYMTFSPHAFSLYDLNTSVKRLYPDATWLDLIVEAENRPDGFCLSVNYNSDIYDRETVNRLINSYYLLLLSGLENLNTYLCNLPILSPEEQEELTVNYNNNWSDYPKSLTIHESFEIQVDKTPDLIALTCDSKELSYKELDDRANLLANKLREIGVKRDQIIGICLPRQQDLITSLLGILKSGAAYLPLDPNYPQDRLSFMLEDSEVSVVITNSTCKEIVHGKNREIVSIDELDFSLASTKRPENINECSDLAYVIYTSGSTGKPKGVMIEHQNVSNFLYAMDKVLNHTADNTGIWLAVTSISFDISVLEIFWSITREFKLILQSDNPEKSNSAVELIRKNTVSHFQCTPSQARMLLEDENIDKALRGLKVMLVGGETLPLDISNNLKNKIGGQLINVYGPTETTIWSTAHVINEKDNDVVPIGNPIANTSIYILDKFLNPVPYGVTGELYLGGEGVARGYLKRENLTKERFPADPFRSGRHRMYRTGDLVRYRKDHTLEFIGRNDNQVKVRGHRIELGEIETRIQQFKEVKEAVTIVREEVAGDQKLIAYIIPENDFSEQGLRRKLLRTLPDYMIPNLFVKIEELPLTTNGKVDRKALPDPTHNFNSNLDDEYLSPRNDTEIRLSILWQELLGIDRIGVRDNFFELGGHSLLSLQLAKKIESEFETEFEPVEIFLSPTIESQAERIYEFKPEGKSTIVTLQKNGEGLPIFCLCGIHLYQELASLIGEDQAFHAMYVPEEISFLAQGGGEEAINKLAKAYYQRIRENHDGRPLRLLGFCFGGALAYEVAILALEDGIEVDNLILLDTVLWSRLKRRNFIRAGRVFLNLFTKGPANTFKIISARNSQTQQNSDEILNESDRLQALQTQMINYKPSKKLAANTILFNSNDPNLFKTWKTTNLLGWEDYLTGNSISINLTGEHTSILQWPMIEQVANQLQFLLTQHDTD